MGGEITEEIMKGLRLVYIVLLAFFFIGCQNETKSFNETGHQDIDRVRMELATTPTDSSNVAERLNTLKLWIRLLSYSGANLNPIRDSFMAKGFESKLTDIEKSKTLFQNIDLEYGKLEEIFEYFSQNPDRYLVSLNRKTDADFGEQRDWPTLRGDEGQTGFTTQSGPLKGKLRWKFPAGHAWYATPTFSDGKVFIGSPGVSHEAYCLDATTGEYIWKTLQKEKQNQYSTPRYSSPTHVVGDHVIVREIGSLGNNGPAKHFVYIDKNTGRETREVYAGHVDYRVGYAPFEGNEEYIVFPHSIQEIGSNSDRQVEVVSFDSLVCIGIRDGARKWKHYMGEFYSEALIAGNNVYCGDFKGNLRCLDLESGKLNWIAETGGAINCKAQYVNGNVIVGNQKGKVISFDAESGKKIWSTALPVEERAFQNFSRAIVDKDMVYIGSADRHLYALDLRSGDIKWKLELDDWIRASPLVVDGKLIVATAGGYVYAIQTGNEKPGILWKNKASLHGIYADLRQYQKKIYVSSSDFYLINIEPSNGQIIWKTSVFESITDNTGERVLADLVGGGPDYQAGTTIANGVAYFGSPRFVYAVDVETGNELWKFETRGQICGAPAVANGKVFFGQQGGTHFFYCVDSKTGALKWKKPLKWVWASPNTKDGKIYIATVAGTFFCCDQDTGRIEWQFESKQGAYPAPSLKGDTVYFGSWNGQYYAFDKDNGKLIWQFDIKGHPDSGSSIVKDGIFYAQGYISKHFYALNADSGKELWKSQLNGEWCNASPVTDGKYVLYSTYIKPLHQAPIPSQTICLNARTGEFNYKIPFAGGLTGAVICNNLVFSASTTDCYMRAWDVATGKIRWQYRMGGRAEETCVSVYGDKAFIVGTDGYLYAFE